MVGAGLAALLAPAAWDVGRPGRVEPSALLALRAIGGLGLTALAALALQSGATAGALVAGAGAAPLLLGTLAGAVREPRRARAEEAGAPVAADAGPAGEGPMGERRAA